MYLGVLKALYSMLSSLCIAIINSKCQLGMNNNLPVLIASLKYGAKNYSNSLLYFTNTFLYFNAVGKEQQMLNPGRYSRFRVRISISKGSYNVSLGHRLGSRNSRNGSTLMLTFYICNYLDA